PEPSDQSTLSLHDALPISVEATVATKQRSRPRASTASKARPKPAPKHKHAAEVMTGHRADVWGVGIIALGIIAALACWFRVAGPDRKSTRLNSSHVAIPYA